MSSAALDRLLAILLVALLASGLLTLRSGMPATAPLFWFHGVAGGALLVAATLKLRRSIGPAVRRTPMGTPGARRSPDAARRGRLAGGFVWVASGRILSLGPWTILTLHVWAALAADPRRPRPPCASPIPAAPAARRSGRASAAARVLASGGLLLARRRCLGSGERP